MSTSDAASLFDQLMTASQEALVEDHHEAAYYALTAALHVAADLHDVPRLRAVMERAEQQMAWIDQYVPGHYMDADRMQGRRRLDFYQTLLQQAQGYLATEEHDDN